MKDVEPARRLAETMVGIGRDARRDMVALLSNMNQPLGYAVGNSLEVVEAIQALRGDPDTPPDFWLHCLETAAHMIVLANGETTLEAAKVMVCEARDSGRGFTKFRAMVAAQGGDPRFVDDPSLLEKAPIVAVLKSKESGYIKQIDTATIGWTSVRMGAGRAVKSDEIDPAVGLIMRCKVGDYVAKGDPLAVIHARTVETQAIAERELPAAIELSPEQVAPLPQFYGVIT